MTRTQIQLPDEVFARAKRLCEAREISLAEISNWTGKAIAAPRNELDDLLQREELSNSGVYFLIGTDPLSGSPQAYIGEAEYASGEPHLFYCPMTCQDGGDEAITPYI